MGSIPRVLTVALVAGLAAALIGCVIDVEGFEATEEDERVFSVSGAPDVEFWTFEGPIEVEGWDRPEVRVVIEKRGANADMPSGAVRGCVCSGAGSRILRPERVERRIR